MLSAAGLHALRNQGRRAITEGLRTHLSQHCEALALPRRWRLLRQLPFNSQGKLPQADVETLLHAPRTTGPEVVSQTQQGHELHLQLAVSADLAYFSGHFPQTPVLPGVVQVDWAIELGQALLDCPRRFVGMEVIKFQRVVRPGDLLELQLRFDSERGKLYFTYSAAGETCSSGRIVLEAVGE
ncbi:3-hydroxyacyl-[acyl-carrier-protein] dehydratase FabZ [compost metagenome]